MKSCPYCGAQYSDNVEVCPVDQHTLESPTIPRTETKKAPAPVTPCPACGAVDGYTPVVELRGSFSWLIFFIGGIFAVVFRNAGRRRKVRCNKCEATFYIRSPLSIVSLAIFWLLMGLAIVFLILLLITAIHTFFSH